MVQPLQKKIQSTLFAVLLVALQIFQGNLSATPLTVSSFSCTLGMTATASCVSGDFATFGTTSTNYWQYTVNTTGYSNIVMQFNSSSSGTGPTTGQIWYNTGCGPDVFSGFSYSVTSCGTKGPFTLPAACNNIPNLTIKLILSGGSSGAGTSRVDASPSINATATTFPSVAITGISPAVGNILQGSTNDVLQTFSLATTAATATLSGLTINTTGTYVSADITTLKCWYDVTPTFNPATATLLSTLSSPGAAGAKVFPSFIAQSISSGTTGYLFITADVSATATVSNTIFLSTTSFCNINLGSATRTGTNPAAGSNTQTIIANTPCSGTPAAGTAGAAPSGICGSGNSLLTLTSPATGTGLIYQWSSSATNVPPGTNIPGATSLTYSTPPITATTYFWCTTTCTASSLSNITPTATVTYNSLPSIGVTPPGGNVCSASGGLSMTASGGATYTWAPSAGLTATTGATVSAFPAGVTVYTVTGTAATGCSSTSTLTVTPVASPAALTMTPLSINTCQGSATSMLSVTGGVAGPVANSVSSGTVNLSVNTGLTAVPSSVTVPPLPAGAVITDVSATVNFNSSYLHDYMINLQAPNGKIINLMNQHIPSGAGSYSNTVISSSSATSLLLSGSPYTGTFAADLTNGIGGSPYVSNTTSWPPLFSVPNGTWTLIPYNSYTGTDNATLVSWTLTISYTVPASVTWSPASQLFTDLGGVTAYTGGATDTVYLNPVTPAIATYTATATNGTCTSTAIVTTTVNPISAISGNMSFCTGSTTGLSDAASGGTWTSDNTTIATIDLSLGTVSGISDGTANITYTSPAGCTAFAVVTVNPLPQAITGASDICPGLTTPLTDASSAGTWISSNTSIATIDNGTGIITGITNGTTTVTYILTATGCQITAPFTVDPSPIAPLGITGVKTVCEGGATTMLSDLSASGVWSSVNTAAATIDASGTVTGVAAGTSVISYTCTNSCGSLAAVATVTVNPLPTMPAAIAGNSFVCAGGATTSLSDATAGGVWSSTNSANATVTFAGLATGLVTGTSIISYTYTNSCGSLAATTTLTVNPLPVTPAGITGSTVVCEAGATTQLSDITVGGVWSSTNTAAATIDAFGLVTGVTAGTSLVSYTYTNSCGSLATTALLNVNPLPTVPVAITGSTIVCEGGATIQLSDVTPGGAWSSTSTSNAVVNPTGKVTGIAAGFTTISYTNTNSCGSAAVTANVTINPLPAAPGPITGTPSVCAGGAVTSLGDIVTGGTWSSSSTVIASVDAFGDVTGLIPGTSVIIYKNTNSCGSASQFTTVTVNPLPVMPATISGTMAVCEGGATTTLHDATSGGTWSSPGFAGTVSVGASTGVVTGITAGTAIVSYTSTTVCGSLAATTTVTVNPLPVTPAAITGVSSLCIGTGATLSDATPGGTWSSTNTIVATVNPSGIVTAITPGASILRYTMTNGCGSAHVDNPLVVIAYPVAGSITGASDVCAGSVISLTDATTGGTWNSSNSNATVAAGAVTGITKGIDTISYSVTNMCGVATANAVVNIDSFPNAGTITGISTVCIGTSITLSDEFPGGLWSSSNTSVSLRGRSVTGVSAGAVTITYALANVCGGDTTTASISVTPPVPDAGTITGTSHVCVGSKITLTNATPGGVWASSNGNASVVGGLVTGVTADTTTDPFKAPATSNITYSFSNACGSSSTSMLLTIDPLPLAYTVMGGGGYCPGGNGVYISLSNSEPDDRSIYKLYADTSYVTEMPGLGAMFNFGLQTIPGVYTVTALNGGGCTRKMLGTATVSILSPAVCNTEVKPVTPNAMVLTVVPNPNKGEFSVSGSVGNTADATVSLEVANMLGQLVYKNTTVAPGGNLDQQIMLGNTSPGMYILTVRSAGTTKAFHIVIEQ
jgi:uncharacterized protein YjdB